MKKLITILPIHSLKHYIFTARGKNPFITLGTKSIPRRTNFRAHLTTSDNITRPKTYTTHPPSPTREEGMKERFRRRGGGRSPRGEKPLTLTVIQRGYRFFYPPPHPRAADFRLLLPRAPVYTYTHTRLSFLSAFRLLCMRLLPALLSSLLLFLLTPILFFLAEVTRRARYTPPPFPLSRIPI